MKKLFNTPHGFSFILYLVLYSSAVVIDINYYYLLIIGFGVLLSLWYLVTIFCYKDLIEEQKQFIRNHDSYTQFIEKLEEKIEEEEKRKEES